MNYHLPSSFFIEPKSPPDWTCREDAGGWARRTGCVAGSVDLIGTGGGGGFSSRWWASHPICLCLSLNRVSFWAASTVSIVDKLVSRNVTVSDRVHFGQIQNFVFRFTLTPPSLIQIPHQREFQLACGAQTTEKVSQPFPVRALPLQLLLVFLFLAPLLVVRS